MLMDAESVRNKVLSSSEEYNSVSSGNAFFELHTKVKHVIDTMPMFTMIVADKVVEETLDICRTSVLSSIKAKVNQSELSTVDEITKFAKTQKKDALYD